jgi:hypothetical protein
LYQRELLTQGKNEIAEFKKKWLRLKKSAGWGDVTTYTFRPPIPLLMIRYVINDGVTVYSPRNLFPSSIDCTAVDCTLPPFNIYWSPFVCRIQENKQTAKLSRLSFSLVPRQAVSI